MSQRRRTGRVLLLLAFVCCALAIGLLMLKKYQDRQLAPTAPAPQTEATTLRVITLFFATPDGAGLARESREVDACADQAQCLRDIIVELIKGPLGDLEPTLPAQSVVNGVTVNGGSAIVDLGESFVEGLPGGSSSEMIAAYSIVNSIAANVPGVSGIKFIIDGKEVRTLKGNLDLRQPLVPDPKLEVPAPSATSGPSGALPAEKK